jgi:imidazole glycerol-phosphate synthase subunit HisF
MLKKRLIPVLFIKNGLIVRSENFQHHKIIGNVVNEVKRYNDWDVDELIYIDISREKIYDSRRNDHKVNAVSSIRDILGLVSKECYMPLAFGGGIRSYNEIKFFLSNGADKVIVNSLLHENPVEVTRAIAIYGSQAIVACIDYRIHNDQPQFYSDYGRNLLPHESFSEIIDYVVSLGCGEVFLNSMDNDGKAEGYDINVIKDVVEISPVPVIACGGAGSIFDFEELSDMSYLSGIAAGNMFHFTENIYPRSKKQLKQNKNNFR